MFRHVGIFGLRQQGGTGLRRRMPNQTTGRRACKSPLNGLQTPHYPLLTTRPCSANVPPRFILARKVHWKPTGARMHPRLPLEIAESAGRFANFAAPTMAQQMLRQSSPQVLTKRSAVSAASLGRFHPAHETRVNSTLAGSGDQTARCQTTSPPPIAFSDSWNRNERAAQPSWACAGGERHRKKFFFQVLFVCLFVC